MNISGEKTEITERNFEALCRLAEDVVYQLQMNYQNFDDEGNATSLEQRLALLDTPEDQLLENLFCRGDGLSAVRYYTAEEIRPWIEPLIPKALALFRKGTGLCGETGFRAAASVPDACLIDALTREIRNMMMIFAGQKMQRESIRRYLLLLEYPEYHDCDEWRGIYFDDEELKRAYEALVAELVPHDCGLRVAIWEFQPRQEWKEHPWDLPEGRQRIRPVKPEELHCFKRGGA